jgi:hypothetical protein
MLSLATHRAILARTGAGRGSKVKVLRSALNVLLRPDARWARLVLAERWG